jgi:hypothetical protein
MMMTGLIGPHVIHFASAGATISTAISGSSYTDECTRGLMGLAATNPAEDAMIALPYCDD